MKDGIYRRLGTTRVTFTVVQEISISTEAQT